jgi:hypothetical protein
MCVSRKLETIVEEETVILTRFEVVPTPGVVVNDQPVLVFVYLSFENYLSHENTHFLVILFVEKGCLISRHPELSEAYYKSLEYLCYNSLS